MTGRHIPQRILLAALGAAALAVTLAGQLPQQPPPPPPPPQELQTPIRAGVELVSVLATVRDSRRQLVADLTREEFRILEDGQEQKVEYFSREVNQPITLGLLIDTSISVERVLGAEQEAAVRFLRRVMRPEDLAFVVSFDVNVDLLGDMTNDVARMEQAVNRARINAPLGQGPVARRGPVGTKLYDAIVLACQQKLARETGRKALLVLTDAIDAGSYYRLEQAIESAQRTNAVIHVILISDPQFYGGRFADGSSVARKLAEETGGRVIEVRNPERFDQAFDEIAEELRTQYVLGYYPTNRNRDGGYRRLKVESTRRGMRILARRGYYAPKDQP